MALNPMEQVEVLRASCCVAGADGDCSPEELAILKDLAANVGVGQASFEAIIARAIDDPDFYKQQFRILKSQPREAMTTLLMVAMADRRVDVKEAKVLQTLAANLELSQAEFDDLVQNAAANVQPENNKPGP